MQSDSILVQCRFLRLCMADIVSESIPSVTFTLEHIYFHVNIINLGIGWFFTLCQAYGDSSFHDCKQASDEAISIIEEKLQV